MVTGDGDALSIGGNHLIHALRRNVNLKILLFNNRIYGLTKGQYSPTSELGKITKSTPMGSLDNPFNPISLAIGAEATFVARTMDSDRKHLQGVLRAAAAHQGTALVRDLPELQHLQRRRVRRCSRTPDTRDDWTIRLEHGEPIRFGPDGVEGGRAGRGQRRRCRWPRTCRPTTRGWSCTTRTPTTRRTRSRCPGCPGSDLRYTPMGVFRSVERDTYDGMLNEQLDRARATAEPDLAGLLAGNDTWTVY